MILHGYNESLAVGEWFVDTYLVATYHEVLHDIANNFLIRPGLIVIESDADIDVW
jgi:hypothetical protein